MNEFETLPLDIFFKDYAASFKCELCDDARIPINPFACDQGHFFCKQCIESCVKNQTMCPNGDHQIQSYNQNLSFRNLISTLKISCPMNPKCESQQQSENANDNSKMNSFKQCAWQGSIGALNAHLQNCELYKLRKSETETETKISNEKPVSYQKLENQITLMQTRMNYTNKQLLRAIEELKNQQQLQHQQLQMAAGKELILAEAKTQKNEARAKQGDNLNVENVIIGECPNCNSKLEYNEDVLFNVTFLNGAWQHLDCKVANNISSGGDIDLSVTDQWSSYVKSNDVIIGGQSKLASLGLAYTHSGQYQSVFGVITIPRNTSQTKQWQLQIVNLSGQMRIGLINSRKLRQSLSVDAVKHGISLYTNGVLNCFDQEATKYQTGVKLVKGDIIGIVFDGAHNLLMFNVHHDKNQSARTIVVPLYEFNINLRSMSWKLYAALCNKTDQIRILDDDYKQSNEADQNASQSQSQSQLNNCPKCKTKISKRDLEFNNIKLADSGSQIWQHADCALSAYKLPKFADKGNAIDEFNKLYAYRVGIELSQKNRSSYTTKSSVYQTAFGVMSVENGAQVWHIQIGKASSNIYLGIYESEHVKEFVTLNTANTIPSANAYYLAWNGQIGGSGLNIAAGLNFSTGDIVSIVLNLNNNTLAFGKNDEKYVIAEGARVANKAYQMFVTMYAINNWVSIIADNKEQMANQNQEIEEKILGSCSECNSGIRSIDFGTNNVTWKRNRNAWAHVDCKLRLQFKLPQLNVGDIDQFNTNPLFRHPAVTINDKYRATGGSSSYLNTFGVISVGPNQGVQKWDIRVSTQPSYSYIGVILSRAMKTRKTGLPNNDGYYFSYNGYIQGCGLSINLGHTIVANDIVTVILDQNRRMLCFGVNNQNFHFVERANLANKYFNLFCSSYYKNTSFEIVNRGNIDELKTDEDVAIFDDQVITKCCNCSQSILSSDLKSRDKNINWNNNRGSWMHLNCKLPRYQLPNLKLGDVDEWNHHTSHPEIEFDKQTLYGGHSSYCNSFGVITVAKQGVKVWDLLINSQPSYLYMGVIESRAIKNKPTGLPSNNAYYLAYNGYIQGKGVSIPMCSTLKVNDRIKIILDLNKNALVFGLNEGLFQVVPNARIKGESFNLFCTSYYKNTSVTILGGTDNSGTIIPFLKNKGKVLYDCRSCRKSIYESDFQMENVKYNSNSWTHIQCNLTIPSLSVSARDMWHRMISNRGIGISQYTASVNTGGAYMNAFGVITVPATANTTKRWNVKIANAPSGYVYIGIVPTNNLNLQRRTGIPSSDGYYCSYNGYIQGGGLNINTGMTFKTGDVIHVVLDMKKGVLSFGKNQANFCYAKGANIKGRAFNLFCNMYYANTQVIIQ